MYSNFDLSIGWILEKLHTCIWEKVLGIRLLFYTATIPSWVEETASRYMGDEQILVDLIGEQNVRTAVTVEHKAICCPYQERPTVINDVIQVC